MKGQHLFIRPAEALDEHALRRLYVTDDEAPLPEPLMGPVALVAKLAGTLVAHTSGEVDGPDLRIRSFYVSRELRRKRIGRGLLIRLEELAARMQCFRLVAAMDTPCAGFLENAGFVQTGGILTRNIERFSAGDDEAIIQPAPQR